MKNTTTFKIAAAAAAVAGVFASQANAAGFMLTEQSAAGLGRAYAGVGVDGSDISGIYYNPATMALHKGTKIQAGFVGIGLNLDYNDHTSDANDANGREKSQAIPFGYILHQINDDMWFGLSMTVPFGMGTEYRDNWAHADHGTAAEILTFDFNPNFAWKLTERFSIGAGVSVQYAKADLKKKTYLADTSVGKLLQADGATLGTSTARTEIDADSTAWGWNVGLMWMPLDNLRFGLSYRSKIKHDASGDLTVSDPQLTFEPTEDQMEVLGAMLGTNPGEATVTAPAWAMATAAWDVNDLLSLYAAFRWTDWSSFQTLDITSSGQPMTSIPNKWRDTYLGSLGADLRLTSWWTLRGGVAYESSPIASKYTRTAIIPDADRWWFSVGSTFKITDRFTTDIGFSHLHGVHERSIYDATGKELGKFRHLDAYLLGVQMQYQF